MTAPLCRYCGEPIRKRTTNFWLHTGPVPRVMESEFWKELSVASLPVDKAGCQKPTNFEVMSVKRTADGSQIMSFTAWDRTSYVDEYFCDGNHAKSFAYVMAKNGRMTTAYAKAVGLKEKA